MTFTETHVKCRSQLSNVCPFLLRSRMKIVISSQKLQNFRNDPETKHIYSLPPLISFKRDKNIGYFLVGSEFESENQPGTFKCKLTRCKICPFISNIVKILGPNRSAKVTDYFMIIFIYQHQ